MFFSKKVVLYQNDIKKTYDSFLDSIDKKNAIHIRGIDMSFNVLKNKLQELGYILTETACYGENIDIYRNSNGFYVDEKDSLYSDENYKHYLEAKKVLEDFKCDFERIHKSLLDKESIMAGNYQSNVSNSDLLGEISNFLGYGKNRKEVLNMENYNHLNEDFLFLENINNKIGEKDANLEKLSKDLIKFIQPYFKENYTLKIKKIEDKFKSNFDSSYGVVVFDKEEKEVFMLYEIDGFDLKVLEYEDYLAKNFRYLEESLFLIGKCLKKQYGILV